MFITHSIDEAVALGDRVLIMTAQPGRAKRVVPVDFKRPRNIPELRRDGRFGELVYDIWSDLRDEVLRAREQRGAPGRSA